MQSSRLQVTDPPRALPQRTAEDKCWRANRLVKCERQKAFVSVIQVRIAINEGLVERTLVSIGATRDFACN